MLLRLDRTITDPSAPPLVRDRLLEDDTNNGVRFLFDLTSSLGWPSQTAPTDEAVVTDIAERGTNGRVNIRSGQSVAYAGGGFDFSGLTDDDCHVEVPAAVASNIWGGGTSLQYFLVCAYFKIPSEANWNKSTVIAPFWAFTTSESGYATPEAGLDTVAMRFGTPNNQLTSRRITNGAGAVDALTFTVTSEHFAKVAQIAHWRNGSGTFLRLRTSAGTLSASGAAGTANSADFSAKVGRFGVGTSWWAPGASADHAAACTGLRLYRGFIENLETSARDAGTVLDRDWLRHNGRFS